MKMMEKYSISPYLLYAYFLIIFAIVFSTVTSDHKEYGTFRAEEVAVVQKIIHPEYYDGKLFSIELGERNPYFNYAHTVAFIAERFGYEENLWELGRIFWVVEKGLAIIIMIILCNFIFPNDKITLLIAITLFISFTDHEATQKSITWPLYLLAIYYFLKEKWIVSGIFSASIFYLHIGVGVWWFGTAGFALLAMFLIQKRVSLNQVIGFCFVTVALSSPIIYFYLLKSSNSEIDEFAIRYFYYIQLWQTSPLLALTVTPLTFANQWLAFAMFYLGYNRAQKDGYDHRNIMLLVIGALGLYFIQFIFADIFSSNFIIPMQLTRAFARVALIFGTLFLGFLLASHLRKGNYIFLLAFFFMYLTHRTYKTVFISIFALIVYEIFEKPIKDFIARLYRYLKINLDHLKKLKVKCNVLLQQPIFVALVLLVMFAGPKLSLSQPLKSYIKSVLHISSEVNTGMARDRRKSLYEDISMYFNEELTDRKALVLYPFLEFDFPVFIPRHDSFISSVTPAYNMFFNLKGSGEFRSILENDLSYSLDRLFKDRTNNARAYYDRWDEMWENLDEDIINRWKERYNMTHVIREKDLPLNFPIVYQNAFYVVYEIR